MQSAALRLEHTIVPTAPLIIDPKTRDIGGFDVRRVLPSNRRRHVGPFIFFDEMGPAEFAPGTGIDVQPHPHIGLATVTYLFDGEIRHQDSLGYDQPIRPGDVNWMTAGRGIVHSERSGPDVRAAGGRLHGIQAWVALPLEREETDPSFDHHPAAALPSVDLCGAPARLIAGTAFGATSPVQAVSPMFYLAVDAPAGATIAWPDEHPQRAVYVVSGSVWIGSEQVGANRMAVLADDDATPVRADEDARLMLFGGAPLDAPRHMFWNFVSSRPERIEQAKADWKAGRFARVPGDDEFVPLPE